MRHPNEGSMRKGHLKNYSTNLICMVLICFSSLSYGTSISTADLESTSTSASPLISNISVTPAPTIRFAVGGANFATSSSQLNVTINVDALVPSVTSGTTANQMFRDDTIGAAYFGYYLTTGVKSASQPLPTVSIKIRKGSAETTNRSYYLLGNGTSTPTSQGDLTPVPSGFTTFAAAGANGSHCGVHYVTNGLTGSAINCSAGSTIANMDITQFVKVLDSDGATASIISQVEFIAVNE